MAVSGSHVQKSQSQHWLFSKLKRATDLAALLLLVCLLPTPATAQGLALSAPERAYLAENAPIVFVSQSNYPPFEFMDDQGQSDGMMVELAQWIADEAGFEARFTHTDFSTAQAQIQAGRADVLTSFFIALPEMPATSLPRLSLKFLRLSLCPLIAPTLTNWRISTACASPLSAVTMLRSLWKKPVSMSLSFLPSILRMPCWPCWGRSRCHDWR
ncbi:transporter substrate-binding domain-containing protein [Halomonas sp. TBZ9]|uniref:Transporter substrate-binding domain-containing protein n=1 Tax=Vreelandella azerica TaxID=2732867 RepID=A0A7Y3U166_9GAMM|nr:transporter substrate-binding domain-containing protein [Halomonas azerica]